VTDGPPLRLTASAGRKKFARNLHEIRTWHGLSEEEVAAECQFPTSKVQALERAATEPESADLVKLASVLRVSVNRLLIGLNPRDFRPKDRPTVRVLAEIEEGRRDARLGQLVAIARGLEVMPSALLTGARWRGGVLYYEGMPVEE
jgi:transcriptional regulator with XRE-family HTH domain